MIRQLSMKPSTHYLINIISSNHGSPPLRKVLNCAPLTTKYCLDTASLDMLSQKPICWVSHTIFDTPQLLPHMSSVYYALIDGISKPPNLVYPCNSSSKFIIAFIWYIGQSCVGPTQSPMIYPYLDNHSPNNGWSQNEHWHTSLLLASVVSPYVRLQQAFSHMGDSYFPPVLLTKFLQHLSSIFRASQFSIQTQHRGGSTSNPTPSPTLHQWVCHHLFVASTPSPKGRLFPLIYIFPFITWYTIQCLILYIEWHSFFPLYTWTFMRMGHAWLIYR